VVKLSYAFGSAYPLLANQTSEVLDPLDYWGGGTLAFSLRRMPPGPATDDALTHTGSSAALRPAPFPSHGPIPFTFPPRPDLHYVHLRRQLN